ncbi:MAG: hypothetical protein ACI4MU_10465 [Candidatus Ventricola sp.]
MTKRILALALALTLGLAGASAQALVGAYAIPETPGITQEARAAFDAATAELCGCTYELVALLGTQVVAGTNYRLLCTAAPVIPDAQTSYVLMTVYVDLDGNAEITAIDGIDVF